MQWRFFLPFDALQIHDIVSIKHSVDTEKQLGMTLLQAFFLPTPPPSTFMSALKAYSAAGNRASPGGYSENAVVYIRSILHASVYMLQVKFDFRLNCFIRLILISSVS